MEGILNISEKMAFWNFWNKSSVQVISVVHVSTFLMGSFDQRSQWGHKIEHCCCFALPKQPWMQVQSWIQVRTKSGEGLLPTTLLCQSVITTKNFFAIFWKRMFEVLENHQINIAIWLSVCSYKMVHKAHFPQWLTYFLDFQDRCNCIVLQTKVDVITDQKLSLHSMLLCTAV